MIIARMLWSYKFIYLIFYIAPNTPISPICPINPVVSEVGTLSKQSDTPIPLSALI